MSQGIIVKGIGGFYYIKTQAGLYECKARGIFRKDNVIPLPGDWVEIAIIDDSKKTGNIERILPRKSRLVRPAVANINQIAAVVSMKLPLPDFDLLDKLLITAGSKEMNVIICINKIDLCGKEECEKIVEAYAGMGCKLLLLSSKTDTGFEQLKDALYGRITVFAGQSGVGKSTMLNKIMNSRVMQTGEISERIERGKHTTRHVELVELGYGGYVLDTPGFSLLELPSVKACELELLYPEFEKHLNTCRFSGCSHISEPGCSIKEAVAEGLIDIGRYERYVKFYNTLKQNKDYGGRKK